MGKGAAQSFKLDGTSLYFTKLSSKKKKAILDDGMCTIFLLASLVESFLLKAVGVFSLHSVFFNFDFNQTSQPQPYQVCQTWLHKWREAENERSPICSVAAAKPWSLSWTIGKASCD